MLSAWGPEVLPAVALSTSPCSDDGDASITSLPFTASTASAASAASAAEGFSIVPGGRATTLLVCRAVHTHAKGQ